MAKKYKVCFEGTMAVMGDWLYQSEEYMFTDEIIYLEYLKQSTGIKTNNRVQ